MLPLPVPARSEASEHFSRYEQILAEKAEKSGGKHGSRLVREALASKDRSDGGGDVGDWRPQKQALSAATQEARWPKVAHAKQAGP